MPYLHDAEYKTAILRRVESLTPQSRGRWGKMSVSQMLWHVNEALAGALLSVPEAPEPVPLPRPLLKFLVINLPWVRGAPTRKKWMPQQQEKYDFTYERDRCVRLINELTSRPIDANWTASPTLGSMSGKEVSRLQAKHLNHHLTQFGV